MPAAAAVVNDATLVALSVVVPTWGRLDQLDSCLDALSRQTLAPERFEIIVVDDAPDHNTLHLVSSWRTRRRERAPRLVYFANNSGQHGVAAARNRGWRIARAQAISARGVLTTAQHTLTVFGISALALCPLRNPSA